LKDCQWIKEKSLALLCSSVLKGETKSLIITAQDQILNTCYYQRNIMEQPNGNKFRICRKVEEHTKSIVVGHTTLASSEYTLRNRRWLVTSTGWYVNIRAYGLLTGTMNKHLEGHKYQ
jgi:hypothetical protein